MFIICVLTMYCNNLPTTCMPDNLIYNGLSLSDPNYVQHYQYSNYRKAMGRKHFTEDRRHPFKQINRKLHITTNV